MIYSPADKRDFCERRFIAALKANNKPAVTFWARMEFIFIYGKGGAVV